MPGLFALPLLLSFSRDGSWSAKFLSSTHTCVDSRMRLPKNLVPRIDTQGSEFPRTIGETRHPSAFTYDYAIRYHAREQAPSDIRTHRRIRRHAMAQPRSRLLRDKIPLKKRDIQKYSTGEEAHEMRWKGEDWRSGDEQERRKERGFSRM